MGNYKGLGYYRYFPWDNGELSRIMGNFTDIMGNLGKLQRIVGNLIDLCIIAIDLWVIY